MDLTSSVIGIGLSAIGFVLITFIEEDPKQDSIQKRNKENLRKFLKIAKGVTIWKK